MLQSLSTDFSRVIRQRGLDYYNRGKVRLTEVDPGDPGHVLAFVQGTRRYTVQLGFGSIEATYSCSCPYFFDREEPCKHLWAVLLKLDKSDFFVRWEAARLPEMVDVQGDVVEGLPNLPDADQMHGLFIVEKKPESTSWVFADSGKGLLPARVREILMPGFQDAAPGIDLFNYRPQAAVAPA